MIALWLLGACDRSSDPALLAAKRALEAWERGESALEAHDPQAARAAFAEARSLRDGPVLAAWEAAAAAEAGDLDGALEAYRDALADDPGFAIARYRYGVLLAKHGQVADAAAELRRAVEDGAARTLDLLEDPDLAPFLGDPAFDFVPEHPFTAAIEPVPATAFWGSEVAITVKLVGLVRPPFRVVSAPVTGPVQLVSVLEEDVSTTQGPGLSVRILLKVVGAGPVQVGPLTFEAGRFQATTEPVAFEASAPPGKEQAPPGEVRIRLPDELLDRVPSPGAGRIDGALVVTAGSTDRVIVEPPPPRPPVVLERRATDGAATRVSVWAGAAPGTRVKVTARGGEVLFDGPPPG